MQGKKRIRLIVLATVMAVWSLVAPVDAQERPDPRGASERELASARSDRGKAAPGRSVQSSADEVGTGYVRRPYGVHNSPNEETNLPPVVDDPEEPFDWYRTPHTAIGVMGGPEEVMITPEGHVRNAFGTLEFSLGGEPVSQRVKTWENGYLPILRADFAQEGVEAHIEYFADTVEGVEEVP